MLWTVGGILKFAHVLISTDVLCYLLTRFFKGTLLSSKRFFLTSSHFGVPLVLFFLLLFYSLAIVWLLSSSHSIFLSLFLFQIIKRFYCIISFKQQALKVNSKILTCCCYGKLLGWALKQSASTHRNIHMLYSRPQVVPRKISDIFFHRLWERKRWYLEEIVAVNDHRHKSGNLVSRLYF